MKQDRQKQQRVEAEAQRLAALLEGHEAAAEPLGEPVDERVGRAIHLTAGACAAVAIQPLPFADILVLTPIQATLAYKIARLRGCPVSREQARRVLAELGGVLGLGLLAQQTALGLYKLGLPGLGGFMTLPLVYGLTYGIGRVIDYYYVCLARGVTFDRSRARAIFKQGRRAGKAAGKREGRNR